MKNIFTSLLLIISCSSVNSQITILDENFQSGIPSNWEIINNNPYAPVDPNYENGWIVIADPDNSYDSVASSTSYFSPVGTSNDWLITPQLTLGNYGNSISWKAKSHDASYPDSYKVLLSTTGKLVSDFTHTIGSINEENFEWIFRSTQLDSSQYLGQSVYIAFVNTTNNGFKLYMDSIIVVKEDPASVIEINKNEFSIYPNPVNDLLHFISESEITNIRIISTSGQVLNEGKFNILDVSNLTSGIYYAEIESNGYKSIRKFSKK